MKAVILAGGLGSRLSEETQLIPKPMVEVGDHPILWHIMSIYGAHGINDFIICGGYKRHVISEYFVNFARHHGNILVDMQTGEITLEDRLLPPWKVRVVDTGISSMTGGRLRRIKRYLEPGEAFCMTYGDGVGNVDIGGSIAFHKAHGKMASMTVVRPTARFGDVEIEEERVVSFREKEQTSVGMINGGFFVLSPNVIDLIEDDNTVWEHEPLQRLAAQDELRAWRHEGFWQPMDTLREKHHLEDLWKRGSAPWKIW